MHGLGTMKNVVFSWCHCLKFSAICVANVAETKNDRYLWSYFHFLGVGPLNHFNWESYFPKPPRWKVWLDLGCVCFLNVLLLRPWLQMTYSGFLVKYGFIQGNIGEMICLDMFILNSTGRQTKRYHPTIELSAFFLRGQIQKHWPLVVCQEIGYRYIDTYMYNQMHHRQCRLQTCSGRTTYAFWPVCKWMPSCRYQELSIQVCWN